VKSILNLGKMRRFQCVWTAVESLNSVLRYHPARLQRKTKCYSKSAQMLELSIRLLIHQKFNVCLQGKLRIHRSLQITDTIIILLHIIAWCTMLCCPLQVVWLVEFRKPEKCER
jgi:hypothetical protein